MRDRNYKEDATSYKLTPTRKHCIVSVVIPKVGRDQKTMKVRLRSGKRSQLTLPTLEHCRVAVYLIDIGEDAQGAKRVVNRLSDIRLSDLDSDQQRHFDV